MKKLLFLVAMVAVLAACEKSKNEPQMPLTPLVPSKDVEAVDLGLSVKWANMNIGATKSEGYGAYFAWGETSPKSDYSWDTYFDTKDGGSTFIKYYNKGGQITLEPEDDAAHVNWGGDWRMPTADEMEELQNLCTWTLTKLNGINGYEVKGKNGNSLFLPLSGFRDNSLFFLAGSNASYWSSSIYESISHYAYNLIFSLDNTGWVNHDNRYYGRPIRPVYP